MSFIKNLFTAPSAAHDREPSVQSLIRQDSFAEDSNEFAVAMYSRLRRHRGNLFFSPFSIRTALGMACAGARTETCAQMRHALRFPSEGDTIHEVLGKVIQRLNATGTGEFGIKMANSLWGHNRALPLPSFVDLVRRCYGEDVHAVDFVDAAEPTRVRINEWTANRTGNRIVDLLHGRLHPDTRLVLVSAVYFKGAWEIEFELDQTRDEPFYTDDGGTSRVPLMGYQKGLWHMQGRGYQAVELNYRDSPLSMLVLLPDQRNGLGALEEALTVQLLNECTTQLQESMVKLSLPRFKFTWGKVDLSGDLDSVGMHVACDRCRADFSGINGHVPPDVEALFISQVLHKAFVDVNETGTEAAAATAVLMSYGRAAERRPASIPVFRADHPFLFALRDRRTGTILFLGRVADPAHS